MFKSIAVVFIGLVTIVVLSIGTDLVLAASGINPPFGQRLSDGRFALAVSYRLIFGVIGCFVTAWIAPNKPMQHALALGCVGTLISIGGGVAMWEAAPPWFTLSVIAINLPAAWAGGKLLLLSKIQD